jgi:hypothetical protein
MLGLLDPGDEIVVFEPYYENYGPDAILAGAVPRYVTLHEPDWSIDPDELRAAFGPRTRAIVVNSPHNPTGKVLSRAELDLIAGLCIEFDALAFTDDIYEHIVFEGEHIPLAASPGWPTGPSRSIRCRRPTRSPAGGIGWTIAPADLSVGIRRVHDFLTVGAAAPLQAAAVVALDFPDDYYRDLVDGYRARRDLLLTRAAHGRFPDPPTGRGVLRHDDIADLADEGEDDVAFALRLIADPGRRGSARFVVLLATPSSAGRSCASRSRSVSRRSRPPPSGSPCSPSGLDGSSVPGTIRGNQIITGGQTMGTTPTYSAAGLDALRSSVTGTILLPDDGAYDGARRVHNGLIDRRPAIIVRCRSAADAAAALRFARAEGLDVSVRGGGHNVAGRGGRRWGGDDRPGRDESDPRRSRRPDRARRGRRPLGRAQRCDRGARAGGHGRRGLDDRGRRPHARRRARLADGQVRARGRQPHGSPAGDCRRRDHEVTEASDADLFWALRGGGGNFGIATALTYRLHPLRMVTGGLIAHPIDVAGTCCASTATPSPTRQTSWRCSPRWSSRPTARGPGWLR